MASWSAASCEPWQRQSGQHGCGRSASNITKTARRRTAMPRHAGPRWPRSPRVGGQSDFSHHHRSLPQSSSASRETGAAPPGSRNKLAQEFIDTAYKLWKEGGETALREVMLKQPARFCKLIARCRRGLFQLARVRLILAIADFCGARGEAWRDGCDKLARRGGVERLP
jgi:hypothetical protein